MNVSVDSLRFQRGSRVVLEIPSLEFASGRVTALLGPNGSGKSTLLRVIAGLEKPAAGHVRFGGERISPRARNQAIAYAFQEAVFLSGSVRSNLELGLRLRKLPAEERARRLEGAARATGVESLLKRDAHALSGGEAQRSNLARALALRAPLTLLDEPLTGLDTSGRRQLTNALPGILREFTATSIVVTHDRDEALRIADDIVVLADGRVHAAGAKAAIAGHPPDTVTAELFGFSVVATESGRVAIAPRSLRPGPGPVTFSLAVEEVADVGTHHEVSGTINGSPVSLAWDGELPAAGSTVEVGAPALAVVRLP